MGRGRNRGKRNKRFRHEQGVLTEVTKPVDETKAVVTVKPLQVAPTTRAQVATDFKLTIPDEVYRKIMHWINKADFEVSGFGSLDYDRKENEFRVRDVILLKQKVGPGSAEICPIAMGKAMYDQRDEPNALKWHWHSHVNMGVFWSADDMEIIRSLGQQGWIVASVFNKKEEIKTAFLQSVDVMGRPHDIFVDNIQTFIEMNAREQEIQAKIKELQEELKSTTKVDSEVAAVLDASYDALVEKPSYGRNWDEFPSHKGGREPYTPSWMGEYQDPFFVGGDSPPTLHANDERRWAPSQTVRAIAAAEYDESGFACYQNDLVYNPIFDQQVKGELQLMVAIDGMTWDEVKLMRECCVRFNEALTKYFTWKASVNRQGQEGNDPDDEELDELDDMTMSEIDFMGGDELPKGADA